MKKVLFFVFFILQMVSMGNVLASTYTGKIETLSVRDYDGLVFIYLSGSRTSDVPDCAKNQQYVVVKNENSASGKRQLALLMMAHAANRTVVIEGANTCTRWVDGEDINIIHIQRK